MRDKPAQIMPTAGSPLAQLERYGNVGALRIANPPVNAISSRTVQFIAKALDAFDEDRSLHALVVYCAGKTFVAGGDIASFDNADFSAVPFNEVLARIEALDRPAVAALHGTALGGGLELALACHYRVAVAGSTFAFPEVKLGLLPGSLGTQRLPRLVGPRLALDWIASGRRIATVDAVAAGLVDEVANGEPLALGREYAQTLIASQAPPRRLSQHDVPHDDVLNAFFDKAKAEAKRKMPFYPAAEAIVEAVRASMLPFAEGAAIESRLFDALRLSPSSKAVRHLFFAEREAAKIPGLTSDVALRPVNRMGVVGAGTMGGGIAMNFLNSGIATVIVEANAEALNRGLQTMRSNYEASASKGRLTIEQVETRMMLLTGSTDYADLADCDLLIEAVYEDMQLKQDVCARLGAVAKPGAVIATNTSTLDVDVLALASGRPADVVGTHFFSPANVMRLLEVVRGEQTSTDVLATVMKLASAIGKVPVVSGVCYGFIGNRMAEVYMREAEFLIMEGVEPRQVDAAVEALGFAMGPCRMLDMAGIDVGAKTVIERGKAGGLPPDRSYRALVQQLFEIGRFGQKTGRGYYRYEGRTPVPDPELAAIASAVAREHGIRHRTDIGADEIAERLLFPLINEGLKILEEGIAYRPGDIDVVWVAGYGFPNHRGGPMWMADDIGLKHIAERLAHYASVRGDAFGYWTPAALLIELASSGQSVSNWKSSNPSSNTP